LDKLGQIADPDKFEAIPGKGVQAEVQGQEILIGTRKLMNEKLISLGDTETLVCRLEDEGKTAMLMAVDHSLQAIIGCS
jgi:Cu+-exporting ATPase